MENQTQSPPWGYLVRLDEAAPIIELRGRFVPILFHEELAFEIDHNSAETTTLWVASYPCWVSNIKVKGKKMKIKYNAVISVKMEKKFKVLFVKRSINEVFLQDAKTSENYIIGKLLGQGGFGQVYTIYKKSSGERRALKVQRWTPSGARCLAREADILLQLEHPCIIQTHDIKYSNSHMYIIMEYMNGGDLSRFVNLEGSHLSVQETKLIFYQIVKAVNYLHSKGICHRDLKPANILLCHPKPHTLIKVSDLGLAKSEIMHGPMYSVCGTDAFLAPEVLIRGRIYDKNVDVWSMGVILYLSLSGTLPMFSGNCLYFTGVTYPTINTQVRHLLQQMLWRDPLMRFDIGMVDQHPWLKDSTIEKKVECLMKDFDIGSGNGNGKNQTIKVHKSQSDKKPISATSATSKVNDYLKLNSVVNKSQSYQIPGEIEEYCRPTTRKTDYKEEQSTLASLSKKPNTLRIPYRPLPPLVERKPEEEQQWTNKGHNYKTINDGVIYKDTSYSTNHRLKPQSYSYELSNYNPSSSYKTSFDSTYASSNQNTIVKVEVPCKINPIPSCLLYPEEKYSFMADIFSAASKFNFERENYYTKNIVPTYESNIPNTMSKVNVSNVRSYASPTKCVARKPIKKTHWNSNAYHNNELTQLVNEVYNEDSDDNTDVNEDEYYHYKFERYNNNVCDVACFFGTCILISVIGYGWFLYYSNKI